jgi:SAM-dependent methyltransferase
MNAIFDKMSDNQILEELVRFCPAGTEESMKAEFSGAVNRYRKTFQSIPEGGEGKSIIDIGARLYTASIYANLLNYSRVAIGSKWRSEFTAPELLARIPHHERISVDYFDAESDKFPYNDSEFDVVVCSELIEHLAIDPMFMLAEINRITRNGGLLVITSPNSASWPALSRILAGVHTYSWSPYNGTSTDRHNREYTIRELEKLAENSGYELVTSMTYSVTGAPFSWKDRMLMNWFSLPDVLRGKPGLDPSRMGAASLVIARKIAPVQERYPGWLYYDPNPGAMVRSTV